MTTDVAAVDHGYERGWTRYGFDNLPFTERAIHGSSVPIGVHRVFHRGTGKAHTSFGIIHPSSQAEAIGMHVHRDLPTGTDVEEWYIIIDGRGVMTFSTGETVDVGAGDLVMVHPGTGHSFRAVGDAPVRLISITPEMYSTDSPVDDYPAAFRPPVEIVTVDPATMNPLSARCRDCGAIWKRPAGDRPSATLAVWARDHEGVGS